MNGQTGPLGLGWHRVTWQENGSRKWVVTESVSSAALLTVALRQYESARMESWSDYPYDKATGGYAPEVSRETLGTDTS